MFFFSLPPRPPFFPKKIWLNSPPHNNPRYFTSCQNYPRFLGKFPPKPITPWKSEKTPPLKKKFGLQIQSLHDPQKKPALYKKKKRPFIRNFLFIINSPPGKRKTNCPRRCSQKRGVHKNLNFSPPPWGAFC